MKPIIIIAGIGHTYTSVLMEFMVKNGFYAQPTYNNPKWSQEYNKWEDKEIQKFVVAHERIPQKSYDLSKYFNSFPKDKFCVIKMPHLSMFLNELSQYTDREIKVIFPIRRINDIILSTMEKKGKDFITVYYEINKIYDAMIDCEYPVYPILMEKFMGRSKQTIIDLLLWCRGDVDYDSVDTTMIKKVKARGFNYYKYRAKKFLIKRI